MKKIIDNILYNTETAELIAEYWNGIDHNDFDYLTEELYRTQKGNFFLYGEGGGATKYGRQNGNWMVASETIIPLTKNEAYTLLVEWDEVELVEKLFPEFIKEG